MRNDNTNNNHKNYSHWQQAGRQDSLTAARQREKYGKQICQCGDALHYACVSATRMRASENQNIPPTQCSVAKATTAARATDSLMRKNKLIRRSFCPYIYTNRTPPAYPAYPAGAEAPPKTPLCPLLRIFLLFCSCCHAAKEAYCCLCMRSLIFAAAVRLRPVKPPNLVQLINQCNKMLAPN
ncbi:unnamed protein product [Ceratitis capitata]|uniref:(Mediterranean fruit fly) hypothetical protein n=1 Tax=Ceratitis capitata TaxID=7213 RepID=A0A811UP95_CERCA|nr:unnamed protein product [Ceratitis capitata]